MTKTRSTSSANRPARFRYSALAAACALAAGGAAAQSAIYTAALPGTHTASGSFLNGGIVSIQDNSGYSIGAPVNDVMILANYASPAVAPVVVTSNSSLSQAVANVVANLVDPAILSPLGGSTGIVSAQMRASGTGAPVVASSLNSNVVIGAGAAGASATPVTVDGNEIVSQTQLNQASSSVSGTLPANYSSPLVGSVSAGYTVGGVSTSAIGAVVVSSQQAAVNAGPLSAQSGAAVVDSGIAIAIEPAGAVAAPVALTGNTIAADYGANEASNSFALHGGSTGFSGSAVVNNGQLNVETFAAFSAPTAEISGSAIVADITGTGTTQLVDSLTVAGNALRASSSGNVAGARTASGLAAGNSLTISGMDVDGTAVTGNGILTNGIGAASAWVLADLALLNTQSNQYTALRSEIDGSQSLPARGAVVVHGDDLGMGSVTSTGNSVAAAATGNLAGNAIATSGNSFEASALAANSQSNTGTSIGAGILAGDVTVNLGYSGPIGAGTVVASDNSVRASAEGNVAATSVNLAATNLDTNAGYAFAVAGAIGSGQAQAFGGASAVNLQGNYGSDVEAQVVESRIAIDVRTQAGTLAAIGGNSFTLDGNSIDAVAAGNTAFTGVAQSGSDGRTLATVGSMQVAEGDALASVTGSGHRINVGAAGGASLMLTDNAVGSRATANAATNSVTADFSSLMANAASGVTNVDAAGTAFTSSGFGIANAQVSDGSASALTQNLLADNAGGSFGAIFASDIGGSQLTANGNSATADAANNRASNTVQLAADTLNANGGSLAGIANSQRSTATGVAEATVAGRAPGSTALGITYSGWVGGATLIANDNTAAARAIGNEAGNRIDTSGSTLSAPAYTAGSIAGQTGDVYQVFSIANVQADSISGGRSATVDSVTVGVSNSGNISSVSSSTLIADGNVLAARAFNNSASNGIALDGYATLDTTAGMLNQQSSSTDVSAQVSDSRVRVRVSGSGASPASVGGVTVSVSDNTVQGLAVGSSASNTLRAESATLTGAGSPGLADVNVASAGDLAGMEVIDLTADFGIVNHQRQTGSASASTSTPVRAVLGPVSGTGGSNVTGGSITMDGNSVSAVAQATSASNALGLDVAGAIQDTSAGIVSSQQATGPVSATVGPESGGGLVLSIDARSFAATPLTVTTNSLLAAAGQNEVFNQQSVQAGSIAGGTGTVDFFSASLQDGSGSTLASMQSGHLGVVAGSITDGSVTVTGNAAEARAKTNRASNTLVVEAAGHITATDLATLNMQEAGTGSAVAVVGTAGGRLASVGLRATDASTAVSLSGTSVTVTGNALQARAYQNAAGNALQASAASLAGTAETGNVQLSQGDASAAVNGGFIGAQAGMLTSTPVTVQGNAALANAIVNAADNAQTLQAASSLTGQAAIGNTQLSGGTMTAASATVTDIGLSADVSGVSNSYGASLTVDGNTVAALAGRNKATNTVLAGAATVVGTGVDESFSVVSEQQAAGGVAALASVDTIGIQTSGMSAVPVVVNGNTVSAQGSANTAANQVALNGASSLTGGGLVDNVQSSSGGPISTSAWVGLVGVGGAAANVTGMPVTVTGNVVEADAARNIASNRLTATAPTLNGALDGFTVSSEQSGVGDVYAASMAGTIGASVLSVSGVPVNVTGNQVTAQGRVNSASNDLVLNAGSSLNSSALVTNSQTAGAGDVAVFASADIGAGITGPAISGAVTVADNSVVAQGSGNSALNTVKAAGATVGMPSFAVLNTQANYAAVTVTVLPSAMAVVTGAGLSGSPATVTGNQALASAYGNTASNAVTLASLGSSAAVATISNSQTNTASIGANVTGATIGSVGYGGAVSSATTVSGNSVTARAVGNAATNVIAATR